MKRKNRNDSWGGKWLCGDDTYTGVDLNRNYGFSHGNFGAKEDPCSESFSGPFPFSEPETRAMRDFIFQNVNELKFVYNFHSYGNMYVTPFNAIAGNLIQDAYPVQFALFEEILAEGHPPNGLKVGTAHDLLGYTSPGEASDWILAATGIPAISPELGTDDPATNSFRLDTPELAIDVMDQHYPIIEKTIEKLQAKVEFKQVGPASVDPTTKAFTFTVEIRNKGLKDMLDFTIMSAQASVEARFDDPLILEGYGFSFFGNKGYTFSPVFARDHIIVQFQGHFVDEIPDDKFTVVLKKVRGEDAVPLFQTLTFHIDIVHPGHAAGGQGGGALHENMLALYSLGESMFESAKSTLTESSSTALYAIVASIVSAMLVYIIAKLCINRRKAAQTELANSIEAFSYDETSTAATGGKDIAADEAVVDVDPETSAK